METITKTGCYRGLCSPVNLGFFINCLVLPALRCIKLTSDDKHDCWADFFCCPSFSVVPQHYYTYVAQNSWTCQVVVTSNKNKTSILFWECFVNVAGKSCSSSANVLHTPRWILTQILLGVSAIFVCHTQTNQFNVFPSETVHIFM